MSNTIIPREIEKFNTWIVNTNLRQLAVNGATSNPFWTDYGWTTAQSTAYTTDWRDEWVNNVFPAYSNPLTSTSGVKSDTHQFIDDFVQFMETELLIEKIKSCGLANHDDELVWNMKLEADEKSVHTDKITPEVYAEITTLGRGMFDIHTKAEADMTRSSIPRDAGADSVQFAYIIVDKPSDAPMDPNSELLKKDISRKAHFEFDAGSANQSKWLVVYFRWFNTSFPKIAGNWGTMQIVAIG